MFATHLLMAFLALTLLGPAICFSAILKSSADNNSNYTVFQEHKTWEDARDSCIDNGQALAYIMTYQEQKVLRDFIIKENLLPKDETSGYWLGARAEDNIWRWDYNAENPRDNNFMAGWHWYRPDNRVNADGNVKECMELQYINTADFDRSLSWNNLWCGEKRRYICQKVEMEPRIHKN